MEFSLDDEAAKVVCTGNPEELADALKALAHYHPKWFTEEGGFGLPLRFARALEVRGFDVTLTVSPLAPWYIRPAVAFLIRTMRKGLWQPEEPK
jgi:hypothetical protein